MTPTDLANKINRKKYQRIFMLADGHKHPTTLRIQQNMKITNLQAIENSPSRFSFTYSQKDYEIHL